MFETSYSLRDLLEAGVHFGHHPRRWNPKMKPFIFGARNQVHIINLQETVPRLYKALEALYNVSRKGGKVLFVGTKRQASDVLADYAKQCGQYYVNHRWLGGMLTNWKTVSRSIKRLEKYEDMLTNDTGGMTKKEILQLQRKKDQLELEIGGIRKMGGHPDILFIIDTHKETIAIKEAKKLGIPVVGIVDTNADPTVIEHPVPGNDDAIRALQLYCRLASESILKGIQHQLMDAGVDIGSSVNVVEELAKVREQEFAAKEAAAAKSKPRNSRGDKKGPVKRPVSKKKTEGSEGGETVSAPKSTAAGEAPASETVTTKETS